MHRAVAAAAVGDVLCVASLGGRGHGVWGEVLMRAAVARGVVGLVTTTGVRDIDALALAGFPAFGHGPAVEGTIKRAAGRHQVTMALGAWVVSPGDWLVADLDGVVVIGRHDLDAALLGAHGRAAHETVAMNLIDDGVTSLEALRTGEHG